LRLVRNAARLRDLTLTSISLDHCAGARPSQLIFAWPGAVEAMVQQLVRIFDLESLQFAMVAFSVSVTVA